MQSDTNRLCWVEAQVLEYAAPGSALLEEDLAEGAEPADPVQQEAGEATASAGAASDALLPAQVMALVGDGDIAAEGDAAGAVIAATVVGEVTICYTDRWLTPISKMKIEFLGIGKITGLQCLKPLGHILFWFFKGDRGPAAAGSGVGAPAGAGG